MDIIDAVAKYTWNDGPFTVSMILSRVFASGSDVLIESTHETWSALMKQSLEGQPVAVDIYMCVDHTNQERISDDSWNELLVASGMWAKVVDKLLLAILFKPELITTLRSEFLHLPDSRTDIVQNGFQRAFRWQRQPLAT